MVIEDKVYDVTPFLLEHPGGDDILLDSSGRDATREFEDVGHSSDARAQLADLCIGAVRAPTAEELANASASVKPAPAPGLLQTLAKWLLPVALVALAVVIRRFVK